MTKTDQQFTTTPDPDRARPKAISQWTLNELLNEVVRIKGKKSRLKRADRETVKTVFTFILNNKLIAFSQQEKPKEDQQQ